MIRAVGRALYLEPGIVVHQSLRELSAILTN